MNRTPSDDVEDGFGVRARGVSSREKVQRTHVRRRLKRYAAAAALLLVTTMVGDDSEEFTHAFPSSECFLRVTSFSKIQDAQQSRIA